MVGNDALPIAPKHPFVRTTSANHARQLGRGLIKEIRGFRVTESAPPFAKQLIESLELQDLLLLESHFRLKAVLGCKAIRVAFGKVNPIDRTQDTTLIKGLQVAIKVPLPVPERLEFIKLPDKILRTKERSAHGSSPWSRWMRLRQSVTIQELHSAPAVGSRMV
jgi:hypothetical protein